MGLGAQSEKSADGAWLVSFERRLDHQLLGKAIRTTYELRTNQDGEARIPEIPQGKIRIQVIAKGYQTFGQIFDIDGRHIATLTQEALVRERQADGGKGPGDLSGT